jgi:hypothetical protein
LRQPGWCGAVFATIALLLQTAVPTLHPQGAAATANGARHLFGTFAEPALCLASDSSASGQPAPLVPVLFRQKLNVLAV